MGHYQSMNLPYNSFILFTELFNTDAFSKMKKNAILVNIGRGGMINQDALVHALENNIIKVLIVENLTFYRKQAR